MSNVLVSAAGHPSRVVPARIREAREASGYTVERFAEELNVTRQTIGQYETGQISPSAEVFSRIISLTEQPPSFFTSRRSRDYESFVSVFWRNLKRMGKPDRMRITRRLEWASDIVHYVEKFIELPQVNLPILEWDWEKGTDDDLERITRLLRDHWELGRGPIFHLSKVMEANGIIIIKENVDCDDMDAVSRWQSSRPYILCSADRDELPRYTFDLAHELGHILLHQGVDVTTENIKKIERQANYFAGAFLLPREMFSNEVVSTSIHYFLKLKERWRVSAAAMIYRCKELGILSASQVSYLYRQLSAKGWRKREPFDTAFRAESPTVLVSALNMLIEHGVQSKADVIDALKLNAHDIERLCGIDGGFFGATVVPMKLKSSNIA